MLSMVVLACRGLLVQVLCYCLLLFRVVPLCTNGGLSADGRDKGILSKLEDSRVDQL